MGILMGKIGKNMVELQLHPDVTPHPDKGPSYEPNFGFTGKRVEKVMVATDAEMKSAKLPLKHRHYCAHLNLKFMKCRREMYPWVVKCSHEKHEYLHCMYEEFLDRMKEYERERRLKVFFKKMENE